MGPRSSKSGITTLRVPSVGKLGRTEDENSLARQHPDPDGTPDLQEPDAFLNVGSPCNTKSVGAPFGPASLARPGAAVSAVPRENHHRPRAAPTILTGCLS